MYAYFLYNIQKIERGIEMYISKVAVRNFRNFNNVIFKFKNGVNTLIGENGSGKTNIFYALRLLLDDNLPNKARKLQEDDFNRKLKDEWKGHWIVIQAEFDELNPDEEAQSLAYHRIGTVTQENKGAYIMYFRPKRSIRVELYNLSQQHPKDVNKIKDRLSMITIDDYETVFMCRGQADFASEYIYKKYVGDFEQYIFPNPEDEEQDQLGYNSTMFFSFSSSITCTFVKALRDVVADLKHGRNNPLLNLLKGTGKKLNITQAGALVTKVIDLNNDISQLDEIRTVAKGISNTLQGAVGRTYAPALDIKSNLPEDIEDLLQSLMLWVNDITDLNYKGKISELSLGGANLIFLSLKLLEYQLKQSTDKIAHFLFIEEPEAHIHTHIQKTLFNNLKNKNTQIIISTHSTHISSASQISTMNILCTEDKETKVYQPYKGLDDKQIIRIERYLDAIRSTILFAKGVMLVEGDAESIVIPILVKQVLGISLDEVGISLINMSSTVFDPIAKIFDADRIQRKCSIITDNDLSIMPLPDDAKSDTDIEKKCRDSQEAGIARKEKLDSEYTDNDFVNLFYAKHTFEVDFLMSGNSKEVVCILDDIYSQEASKITSKTKLESINVAIAGREILRLAEKKGKGWLALILGGYISYKTNIPDYILKAIAFAVSKRLTNQIKIDIAKYRIMQDETEKSVFGDIDKGLLELMNDDNRQEDFFNAYIEKYPQDVLTKLVNYCEGN